MARTFTAKVCKFVGSWFGWELVTEDEWLTAMLDAKIEEMEATKRPVREYLLGRIAEIEVELAGYNTVERTRKLDKLRTILTAELNRVESSITIK